MRTIQKWWKKLQIGKGDMWVLLPILAIGLFLRLNNLSSMVGFDFDQEYAATFAKSVLEEYPIRMIGQGLSVQGLFMGPWYFYFLVPFFALTRMHPIGGYIGSIVLFMGGIVVSYIVLKNVFGKPAAIVGALLSSILYLYIEYSWVMAPTYSSVCIVFLTWFCIYKYWHGNLRFLPLLGFLFGMYTSFHPVLFPFYLVFLCLVLMKRKFPSVKGFLLTLFLFILPIIPLLMFEYFRNFLELKVLLTLDSSSGSVVKSFDTLLEYVMILYRFPVKMLGIPVEGDAQIVFSQIFYLALFTLIMKKVGFWKDRFHVIFLMTTIIIFLGYNFILPIHVPDYYFLGVEGVLFIYSIASLSLLWKTKYRAWLPIILSIIMLLNIRSLVKAWSKPKNSSLAAKEYILRAIQERQKGQPNFAISYSIDPGQEYGLGYLTRLFRIDPRGEPDTTYEIVLPTSRTKDSLDIMSPSGGIGVVIHKK